MILIKFVSFRSSDKFALKRFAQSSKMGTAIKGFHARLANQPLLVLTFGNSGAQPWAPECPKGKTKNGVVSLNSCSYFSNAELKWVNGPDRAIGVCVCVCVSVSVYLSLCTYDNFWMQWPFASTSDQLVQLGKVRRSNRCHILSDEEKLLKWSVRHWANLFYSVSGPSLIRNHSYSRVQCCSLVTQ